MAASIVDGAIARGELGPGLIAMDYTGGSTGSSIAMVCAARGIRSHFVTSNAFSESKLRTMRAFGATLEILPAEGGKITQELFQRFKARVQELRAMPEYFYVDQFNNPDNAQAYGALAREIIESLSSTVDAFVMGVGTGGCFSGVSRTLKESVQGVKCFAVEPENSQLLAGLAPTGGHRLEGIGVGFVSPTFRPDLCDGILPVSDSDAIDTARKLAQKEGIFGGTSSGANVFTALKVAKMLGSGRRVVTIICDSGLKYLDGELYA